MITRKFTGSILIALAFISLVNVQGVTAQEGADDKLLLWEDRAPDVKGDSDQDQSNVTVFLPDEELATGAGVVVFPGGAYRFLAIEKEGYKVAQWLNSIGVAAFVVKYRLGERYNHPAQIQDAQRAIRMVRHHAKEWKVDRNKLGILGFSAGGHLASTAGIHFDYGSQNEEDPIQRLSARPDFMILIYPVVTMKNDYTHQGSRHHLLGENPDPELVKLLSNEQQVTDQTPPTFIIHGSNDTVVPVQNSTQLYLALREHNIPAEMHLFEDGPHGFGLGQDDPELSVWPDLCERWMRDKGFLGGN